MAVAAPAGRGTVRERGPDPGRRGGDAAARSAHPPGRNGARHARYLPGSRPARPAHVSRRLRHRAPGGGRDGPAGGRDADPGVCRCGTGRRDGPAGAGARRPGAEGRDRRVPRRPGAAAAARRQRPAPRAARFRAGTAAPGLVSGVRTLARPAGLRRGGGTSGPRAGGGGALVRPAALPFIVFVAILPFRGTVTVRLACLAVAGLIVAVSWRRLAPPALPCRWTIALWAAVALGSLLAAVDPAYSVREIRSEVGYALVAFVAFLAWTRSERRLRLACLAVLVGFAAISSSALLGAYLRNGVWPAEAYYGDVGRVSSYLVTVGPVLGLTVALFGRRHPARWLVGLGVPFLAVALLCAERALWPALGVQAAAGNRRWRWRMIRDPGSGRRSVRRFSSIRGPGPGSGAPS